VRQLELRALDKLRTEALRQGLVLQADGFDPQSRAA
jgi:hypothetical protein